ncbi:MAG: 16S rRNA (cytosine(967)-C(5))-methyltransferase RsmB [Gemmatimonadota bacterium]
MSEAITAPRRAALDVLTRVRDGDLSDRALARVADGLNARDRAWVQELVYGTLRLRGRLDHILAEFVRGGMGSLQPVVLDILRLGAYQLLEMGSVPAYAAVSQSVELTRAAGVGRAAGLVNGVLQSVRRGWRKVTFPSFEDDPVAHLTTQGSHPKWLVERWVARWGADEAKRLVEANNSKPELYITPSGMDVPEALASLAGTAVTAEPVAGFADSIRILPPHGPTEALAAVRAVVQDPAAAMVVRYAGIPEGATVLDLSAAPGGKAVGLASRAGYVVANDVSLGRMRRVRTNVARAGVAESVGLVVADGREAPYRRVDAVLVDAPCTGTGTLRRHADGRWRLTPADLASLTRLQRELLDGAAGCVRRGGLLVYATCSLEPEENEEQVSEFLTRHAGFRIEAPPPAIDGTMLRDGMLAVLPQRHGVDGAFAARLRYTE